MNRPNNIVLAAWLWATLIPAVAIAQSEPAESLSEPAVDLPARQDEIAKKYQRLEEIMLKMADFQTATNPAQAKLLRQAVALSKSKFTARELNNLVELLATQRLKPAIDGQAAVKADLEELLNLLLTASRPERLKSEQARVREYIQEIERLQRLEQGIRGRTEGSADPSRLAQEQEKTADRAAELAQKIAENEEAGKGSPPMGEPKSQSPQSPEGQSKESEAKEGEPSEGEPSEGEPAGGEPAGGEPSSPKPSESQPSETEPREGEPKAGEPKEREPSEGEPSESPPMEGQPSESQPSESQPSESQPSESQPSESQPSGEPSPPSQDGQQDNQQNSQQPPAEEFPAKKRIREAEEKMREAQRKLSEARRDEAVEAQREAERKLQEAKAELEEILRQMREEEVERMLAMLEGRFRKMLEQELRLYESTRRLDKIESQQRNREFEIQAGRLAHDQRAIGVDAEKALQLLLEEGSSIAFPETVELMVEDMEQVAHRLDRLQVDSLTQGVEEEIIQTLEELIESLQQAQQDLEEQKQQNQQQQQQSGAPEDQPLVDKIAELRMIRALQLRVNLRTQRYAGLLDDPDDAIGQAPDAELREALKKLAEREQRVRRITRDIVLEKNK